MLVDLEAKRMSKESPILVRIFKEEAELDVWKQDNSGRFALLRTYPICRWSGELGPKIKQGDRQAPEGFYTISPGQMNPNSSYYLAINTGFPNAYDRANGRTGAFLMIHGDCASAGCYAMTDEQIAEIYALAREAFFGGQKSFQLEAFPFRMTPLNMARHAELIGRGAPTVPVSTAGDGGMNPTFRAALRGHGRGATIRTASGTIPAHVSLPAEPADTDQELR
jgi:murein L,D-transpeptidase YafK